MSTTSVSVTPSRLAISFTVRMKVAFLERGDLALSLAQVKNSFFWFAVVPIFTSDHERRMYPGSRP